MRKLVRVVLTVVGLLALLAGVGWAGLQVKPKPIPPHPEKTRDEGTVELPTDLPEPVQRHFEATLGKRVPKTETAVVWGRGEFNLMGLWFPMRFESYHVAGREFRREMELTWFGVPIFRGYDSYIGGKGTLEFTGLFGLLHVSDEGTKLDQGDDLAMWAEAPFTTPSVLVLDPRVRWEPVDAHTARLVFPLGDAEDSLRVAFDPKTGLIRSMFGMRYRGQEETKTPYRGEYGDWETVDGIKVPHHDVAIWEDQVRPYVVLHIEGTEYNVDVSEKVPRQE
jgi:hypothetical protein